MAEAAVDVAAVAVAAAEEEEVAVVVVSEFLVVFQLSHPQTFSSF